MVRIVIAGFLLVVLFTQSSLSQVSTNGNGSVVFGGEEPVLTARDSILGLKVPELIVPAEYRERNGKDLPAIVNNAELPFLRPVFSQESYANCGQSAGIGYNFTYEINRIREAPADDEANQYTPQFAWNFMNGGDGWYGVSYFHSFEILKKVGTPSVSDYGGMFYGGESRWMSGFEHYRNSMQNRIEEVYFIDVSTMEGIQTLKYWLYDHLEGDDFGGIASFYSYSAWDQKTLPEDSPEAGKHVITRWKSPATHALTIVGYNDSIRYDFNNDGIYTNDVDINGDGLVDLKDWEIGGFLFVNSYGDHWADSGFCYAMYSAFAFKYEDDGIWNQSVNVLKINPDYQPLIGMKIKLKHNSRNKLKIIAGVSADTSLAYPEHTMDFPVVNYQGGDKIVQGLDTIPDGDEIELELDITPLLTYVTPGAWSKFFVQVVERDADNEGNGRVLYFSIVDYNEGNEIVNGETPTNLLNNSITTLSLVKNTGFDKLQITTEDLPALEAGVPYNVQLQAEGGEPPYDWAVFKDYEMTGSAESFPAEEGMEIEFSNPDSAFVRLDLPFSFPFYGEMKNQVLVYVDGFVKFEKTDLPYPYFIGETTMFKNNKMIAPFLCNLELLQGEGNKVTYQSTADFFLVKWDASPASVWRTKKLTFALKLFPSGEFITYFEDMDVPAGTLWTSGVSMGDGLSYLINHKELPAIELSGTSYRYKPLMTSAENLTISPEGWLEMSDWNENKIYKVRIKATDRQNISEVKTFGISTGITISYLINSGNDAGFNAGETVVVKAIVKNISTESIENIRLNYTIEDDFVILLGSNEEVGTLAAGEIKVIDSSLVIQTAMNTPDRYLFRISNRITGGDRYWDMETWMTINSPVFDIVDLESNGNTWIETGWAQQVNFRIQNTGHGEAENVEVKITLDNDLVEIIGQDTQTVEYIPPGGNVIVTYSLKADTSIVSGSYVKCVLSYYKEGAFMSSDTTELQIGRVPALLVDLDPNHISAPKLSEDFETIRINYKSVTSFPAELSNYRSVFLLLGSMFSNHELTSSEGSMLADYLDEGGNLYMEGRETWQQEPTPVHNLFDVSIPEDNQLFFIDTIYTFPEDTAVQKKFVFESNRPYNDYYFIPGDSAQTIFLFSELDSACVVANDEGAFKTVASIIEYGALAQADTSYGRIDYLNQIVRFFRLNENVVGTEEQMEVQSTAGILSLFPNPFVNNISILIQAGNASAVVLQIFDTYGTQVYNRKIYPGQAGVPFVVNWNGRTANGANLPGGIYFIRLLVGNRVYAAKAIRL